MTTYCGPCVGGPYQGESLIHHEPICVVALDNLTGRALVGQQGASVQHPSITFKAYVWHLDELEWRWDETPRQLVETVFGARNPQA